MKKENLLEDDKKKMMPIYKEKIISDESNIFDEDKNAPGCYELSALFFVYKFLFR